MSEQLPKKSRVADRSQVTARLTTETRRRLDNACYWIGRTQTWFFEQAIKRYIDDLERERGQYFEAIPSGAAVPEEASESS